MSPLPKLSTVHHRRLREVWRSGGWPCQDMVEVELLANGLLERLRDEAGRETLRVTDTGIQILAQTLNHNRATRNAHEELVGQVVTQMQRSGRIVWRGLSLRAALERDDGGFDWVMAMPDVYSIRHTTVEDYAEPIVHEIKVHRSDLLADLKRPDKGAAYRALSSQCWYVLKEGIANPDEVPEPYGVMVFSSRQGLEVARPAPKRPLRIPFSVWMRLARATCVPLDDDDAQAWLGVST